MNATQRLHFLYVSLLTLWYGDINFQKSLGLKCRDCLIIYWLEVEKREDVILIFFYKENGSQRKVFGAS